MTNYLDFYNISHRSETFSVEAEFNTVPLALSELYTVQQQLTVRETELTTAEATVANQERLIRETKATDYIAREQAIAPLRTLVPARDRAAEAVATLREILAQRQIALVHAIAQRHRGIAEKRVKLAEMAAELDRQEEELKATEERHLKAAPNGETTE